MEYILEGVTSFIFKQKLYLHYDEPQYEVSEAFFKNNKLWCHVKDNYAPGEVKKINTIELKRLISRYHFKLAKFTYFSNI